MTLRFTTVTLMSWALAATLACGSNNPSNAVSKGDQNPNATTPNGSPTDANAANGTPGARVDAGQKPVTLTGCLQQGSGRNTFILTTMNEPSKSVGTSGAPSGDTVRRDQLREAERAYELNAKGADVNLRDLVGKQVKISGTLVDRGDLPTPGATSGPADRDKGEKIKASDLAKVDVVEATATGQACGQRGKSGKAPARSKSGRRSSRG